MNDLTTSYFSIEKSDKQPDGTLMVYGKATDDSVDIDQQICDAAWLDRAMPAWFKSGGNIREQHSSIAAGVAKEYEPKADGHYIMAHIVDPVSVKKVDAGVLRGFSIGIKSPRVVRDTKAANGRIIDGQIVEVSLVDRPANPNCQLVLAKSVDGESSLVQVEELSEIEKHGSHDQKTHGGGRGRGGGAGGGAGGSASASENKPASGRDNKKAMSIGDDASAIGSEIDDIIDEHDSEDNNLTLSDSDLKAANSAGKNIDQALTRIGAATDVESDAKHYSVLSEASDHLDEAASDLLNADNRGLRSLGKDLMDNVDELDEYLTGLSDAAIAGKSLVKHGSHDQKTHGGGRGRGGASGLSAAGGKLTTAVNGASSLAIKHGNVRMRDRAYEATKSADQANEKIKKGDKAGAKEYFDSASDAVNQLPEMAEKAGLSTAIVEQFSNFAADARKAHTEFTSSKKSNHADLRKALQSALQLHSLNKSEEATMDQSVVELPVEVVADLLKFDAVQYEAARNALASLIEVEAGEMRDGHNEIQSISHLLQSVMHLTAWYEGEEAEGEVMEQEEVIERAAGSKKEMKPAKDETKPDFLKRCKDAGMEDDAATATWDKYMAAMADDAEKSAEISKCLECGCNQPGTTHGLTTTNDFANVEKPSHVTTAEMYAPGESPKSAEGEEPATATEEEVKAEEPATEETPAVETTEVSADDKSADVEALVEQVVKSATESLKSEIAELVSAKEAALSKAMSLETELELAKSLAVAGGPSRTARPINVKTTNDLLTKAAIYKAKANATTDPTLAKGYKSLAEEFLNKANEADNK